MCFAGGQSNKNNDNNFVGGQSNKIMDVENDEEMSDVDCRKRSGEEDVSTDSIIQVWTTSRMCVEYTLKKPYNYGIMRS